MDDLRDAERRLTELEIKASFADDMLEQLNQVILRHQQRIDSLERQVLELRQHMPEDGGAAFRGLRDELPPHY